MKTYFAADLGATSGRTILGTLTDEGQLHTEELTRFSHPLIQTRGHYYWDILHLYNELLRGLREVAQRGIQLSGIGIDTWGVDSVCIGADGGVLRAPRSYRDPATFSAMEDYLSRVHSREELYDATGTEILNFNSIFQYHAMRLEGDSALEQADGILFMPDALAYMLTGERVCEYTIASTSGLLSATTRDLDPELLRSVGLRREQFGRLVQPGQQIGVLTPEVQQLTGLGPVPVIAVAGHDTQSAIAALPAEGPDMAYLSSGTWSLMGIETPQPIITERSRSLNYTNEGGIEGTTCLLKNICGMWLLESCRREWAQQQSPRYSQQADAPATDYDSLIRAAEKVTPFRSLINPDAPDFAAPQSMVSAIRNYCRRTPQPVPETPAELTRCIFDSLVMRYREVLSHLQEFSSQPIHVLHIIGGGSRNAMLCQHTANALSLPVVAGPTECTALGNILLQATASTTVCATPAVPASRWDMRRIVRATVETRRYEPQPTPAYAEAYERYLRICH